VAKIIIFGNGQIASVGYSYLLHDSKHEVVAFTVDNKFINETYLFGLPVVPFDNIESLYPPDQYKMLIMVSYKKVNQLRAQKFKEAKIKGFKFITYIHSKASIWPDLEIGENCFIMEQNVIQPFVSIGDNVIIWSGNHIGHHTTIHDHCFISSHVVVSGSSVIKPYCFLGVNSTIRDGVTVAEKNVVGAGALVLKNTGIKDVHIGATGKIKKSFSDRISI